MLYETIDPLSICLSQ